MDARILKVIGYLFIGQLILQVARFYEGLFWIWRLVDFVCAIAFFPAELLFGSTFMYSSASNFGLSLVIDTLAWSVLVGVALTYKASLIEKFLKKL